jgi:hypothetical protein
MRGTARSREQERAGYRFDTLESSAFVADGCTRERPRALLGAGASNTRLMETETVGQGTVLESSRRADHQANRHGRRQEGAHLISELPCPAVAGQGSLHRGLHVTLVLPSTTAGSANLRSPAPDETAQLKKGYAAACVAPQHTGCTGHMENCVTTVSSAYVTVAVWRTSMCTCPGALGG